MTNHTEINKTNYFRVTDEEKYKKLFSMLTAEDTIHDLTKTDKNDNVWHAFSCCAPIDFHKALYDDNGNLIENGLGITDYDFARWTRMLQKILDEKDTFIFYGPRCWTVISKHFGASSSVDFEAKRLAEELLDDEEELIYRRKRNEKENK